MIIAISPDPKKREKLRFLKKRKRPIRGEQSDKRDARENRRPALENEDKKPRTLHRNGP